MAEDASGKIGYGMTLKITPAGGSELTLQLTTSADLDPGTAGKVDVSHSTSPNRRKQYKLGWTDSGTCSVEALYTNATWNGLKQARVGGKLCQIVLSVPAGPNGEDGFTDTWSGYVVTEGEKSIPATEDEAITITPELSVETEIATVAITAGS